MHNNESSALLKEFQKTVGPLMDPYHMMLCWRITSAGEMPDSADAFTNEFTELTFLFSQHWKANAFGFNAARAGLLFDLWENCFEPYDCKEKIDNHINFLIEKDPSGQSFKDPPTDALDHLREYDVSRKTKLADAWKNYLIKVIDKVLSLGAVKQAGDDKFRESMLETLEQAATGIRNKNFLRKQGPELAREIAAGVLEMANCINALKADDVAGMATCHPLSRLRQEILLVILGLIKTSDKDKQARLELLHDVGPSLGRFGSDCGVEEFERISEKLSLEGPPSGLASVLEMIDHVDKFREVKVGDAARKLIFGIVNTFLKVEGKTLSAAESKLLEEYAELLFSKQRYGSGPLEGSVSNSGQYKAIDEDDDYDDDYFDDDDDGLSSRFRKNIETNPVKHRELAAIIAELDEMVGLDRVKSDVQQMVNFIKVQQMRDSKGMAASPVSKHLVFYGNPGTGKTTVARLIAELYRELKVLRKGHLIEVERSGLVGGFVGQTAIKVKEVVTAARGGVLFIDEAYTLAQDSKEGYGQEAIDTLLKLMEDYRDDLVVIVAGYPERMAGFINSNPGLRSRFNKFFDFEDYTADQMLAIFHSFARSGHFKVSPEAESVLTTLFQKLYEKRNEASGNGRDVRNVFESILQVQANRIVSLPDVNDEVLSLITAEDVQAVLDSDNSGPKEKAKYGVGFRVR